jgi:hypothetical protein
MRRGACRDSGLAAGSATLGLAGTIGSKTNVNYQDVTLRVFPTINSKSFSTPSANCSPRRTHRASASGSTPTAISETKPLFFSR